VKILLLGGTGFLGTALREALHEANLNALAVSRSRGADIQADLRRESEVASLLSQTKPDLIVNLATAGLSARTEQTLDEDLIAVDIQLPQVILGWIAKSHNSHRYIHVGSALHLAPSESAYAMAKLKSREALIAMMDSFSQANQTLSFVNIHNCYGPGQPRGRFIADAFHVLANGGSLEVRHPRRRRDFVFISDVANSLVRVIANEAPAFSEVEVGTGHSSAIGEVAKAIAETIGLDPSRCITNGVSHDAADEIVAAQIGGSQGLCHTSLVEGLHKIWRSRQ
jgi:nucleoside-diphosphate-sugar epimerase